MKRKLIPIFFFIATIPCAAQWKSIGFSPYQIYAFGVHDSILFLSAPDHIYRYDIGEADSGIGFGSGNIMWFSTLGRYFYANEGQGITQLTYRSSDNGSHWQESPSGNGIGSNGYYLFGKYQHFSIGPYMALSRDSGLTWDSVANFIANTITTNGTCVFANTGSVIWRSRDTGNTWSKISPPFVGTMTVMDSLLFIVGNGALAESTDSGTQWDAVPVDSGTVQETVNVLASDGKNLFAGTTNGVYVSTDIGKSWRAENEGLVENVSAIAIFDTSVYVDVAQYSSPSQSFYYAYERPISEMTDTTKSAVQEASQSGNTLSIYPNPLSNSAMITYSLAEQSRVTITIIDALGRAIAFPVSNESRTIGTYSLDIDANTLPSGIYWCRLSTDSEERTAKLIIRR
jgi:Secretion system C-terminal sorting domain